VYVADLNSHAGPMMQPMIVFLVENEKMKKKMKPHANTEMWKASMITVMTNVTK
jgi:hypothetical protein